jgi:hypothetical protein
VSQISKCQPSVRSYRYSGYDSVQTELPAASCAVDRFITTLGEMIKFEFVTRNLIFNKEHHDIYLLKARQAFEIESALAGYPEDPKSSTHRSPSWGTSSSLIPNVDGSMMDTATDDSSSQAHLLSSIYNTVDQDGTQHPALSRSFSPMDGSGEQTSKQPFQDFVQNDWVHAGIESQQSMKQNERSFGLVPPVSTFRPYEEWTHINPSLITLSTTNAAEFSLSESAQLDPCMNYEDEFLSAGRGVLSGDQDGPRNSQPHDMDLLDTSVERIRLNSSERVVFREDSQNGEDPLSALLFAELELKHSYRQDL